MATAVPTSPGEFGVRGPRAYVHWYGGRILTELELATVNTVRTATQAAARYARANHPWQSRHEGGLEDSIFAAEPEIKGDHVYAIWGAHWPALYLEYGTVKMPPYPFLRPAADHAYRVINFAGAIRHEMHGSTDLGSIFLE